MLAHPHDTVGDCTSTTRLSHALTPFELKLRHELDLEFRRMDSDWFFRWHNLNIQNSVVDVDRFDGGRIHTGGVVFEGQIQQIYWETLTRFLKQTIHATFATWKRDTADYPIEQQKHSLEGVAASLWRFVSKIIEHGVDTDRRLRGSGYPENVKKFNASGFHSAANAEIERLRSAHSALVSEPKAAKRSSLHRLESFFSTWPGIVAISLALLGIIA